MCTRRPGPFATPHLRRRVLRSSTPRRHRSTTAATAPTRWRWPRASAGLRLPDASLQPRRSPPVRTPSPLALPPSSCVWLAGASLSRVETESAAGLGFPESCLNPLVSLVCPFGVWGCELAIICAHYVRSFSSFCNIGLLRGLYS